MEEPITIVSGLPRSGTSMLMQMLDAGGLPLLVDEVRVADFHNPKGYYEFEATKRLKNDASWLPIAQGKAIKIVSHFLEYLPHEFNYRVLFVKRNLNEVLASQNAMLQTSDTSTDEDMKSLFQKHLAQVEHILQNRSCFKTLYLEHGAILEQPCQAAESICLFLDQRLDIDKMAQIVDARLHRNRGEA